MLTNTLIGVTINKLALAYIDVKLFLSNVTMAIEKAHKESPDHLRADAVENYSVFTTAEKWCIVAMVSYAESRENGKSFVKSVNLIHS